MRSVETFGWIVARNPAEVRGIELQDPAVSLDDVLDDSKTEPGAAALVESSTPRENDWPDRLRDAGTVVLNRNPQAVRCGCDPDPVTSMASCVLKQIAQRLREIGAVERHHHLISYRDLVRSPDAFWRPRQSRNQRMNQRCKRRGCIRLGTPDTTQPSPRELAVDMTTHGPDNLINSVGNG